MEIKKVNLTDQDFNRLIRILDNTLSSFNSDIQSTEKKEYHAFNSVSDLTDAFVAFSLEEAIGCVATKHYATEVLEMKRLFVNPIARGAGIATKLVNTLESQAYSDGYKRIVVETGKNNSDAIRLYTKMNYQLIDNYPPYDGLSNSVCMSKNLL
ncbi:MAG: GNAT family N-acetyltransferase [Liquorilactobacillus satsumensis]|uniref:GNAT family N-acetyltransferase n=1 Tax=Lactobacillaceae TaxID=33958 RepID=UPI001E44F030|nr:GNAT family N-acetyltransferase [Leuconostoc pseudomesenteroides]MCC8439785.1 GNAT family N-acetyltransferase [Leuconostoc pseudomesenteroides]